MSTTRQALHSAPRSFSLLERLLLRLASKPRHRHSIHINKANNNNKQQKAKTTLYVVNGTSLPPFYGIFILRVLLPVLLFLYCVDK